MTTTDGKPPWLLVGAKPLYSFVECRYRYHLKSRSSVYSETVLPRCYVPRQYRDRPVRDSFWENPGSLVIQISGTPNLCFRRKVQHEFRDWKVSTEGFWMIFTIFQVNGTGPEGGKGIEWGWCRCKKEILWLISSLVLWERWITCCEFGIFGPVKSWANSKLNQKQINLRDPLNF